jgi:RNA polymerase sigma-70 factor (ECF subfamily)
MDLDANQLMTLVRRDCPAAAVHLVEQFYERIYAFLRRFTGNDADAGDLTQQTFGRAQRALPGFAGRSSVASWIHGIAYHVYVDWRRANYRAETRSDEWWSARVSGELLPDELAAQTDLAKTIYAAVDGLELDLRESVHLHYFQGLTLQETADAIGVASSTVKYRLRQAMGQLGKILSAERPEPKSPSHLKTS